MSKFNSGDKVKIVRNPPNPERCGLEGKIVALREGWAPNTQAIADGGALPQPRKQWKYDVQVDCPPQDFLLHDLDEEWLELP